MKHYIWWAVFWAVLLFSVKHPQGIYINIHPSREVRNLNKNAWNFRNKHHRKTEQLKDDFYWCSLQWICFIWLSAASIPSSCFLAFPIPQMALLHKIHSYIWPNHVVMHADDDGDYGCLFKIPMFRIFIPKTVDYIEEAQSVSWCLLFFKADILYVFLLLLSLLLFLVWIILKRLNPSACHSWIVNHDHMVMHADDDDYCQLCGLWLSL